MARGGSQAPLPGRARARSRSRRSARSTSSSSSLDRALEALEHQDIELAAFVVQDDDRLDGRYLEVHQGILSLLALQAPVAGDLRVVAALLHVIKHAERMGDQCVNIAKLLPLAGLRGAGGPRDPAADREDGRAGALARSRRPSRRSCCATSTLAEDLVRQDAQINRLNRECFQRAVETGDDLDRREWAMTMMLVARALERIGDNAVDIGEQVAFVVTGLFREFSDASRASHVAGSSPRDVTQVLPGTGGRPVGVDPPPVSSRR